MACEEFAVTVESGLEAFEFGGAGEEFGFEGGGLGAGDDFFGGEALAFPGFALGFLEFGLAPGEFGLGFAEVDLGEGGVDGEEWVSFLEGASGDEFGVELDDMAADLGFDCDLLGGYDGAVGGDVDGLVGGLEGGGFDDFRGADFFFGPGGGAGEVDPGAGDAGGGEDGEDFEWGYVGFVGHGRAAGVLVARGWRIGFWGGWRQRQMAVGWGCGACIFLSLKAGHLILNPPYALCSILRYRFPFFGFGVWGLG